MEKKEKAGLKSITEVDLLGSFPLPQESMTTLGKPEIFCGVCSVVEMAAAGICGRCTGLSSSMQKKKELALGGKRAFDTFTFDTFRRTERNQSAIDACRAFDPASDNLLLVGPVGSGKSHLATAAARSHEPMIRKPMDLFRAIRSCDGAEEERKTIRAYIDSPVLVLDDIGTEKDTAFTLVSLYEVIDGRYMSMSGGLIVTSNLSLGEMAQKWGDDRLTSRLAGMCKVLSLSGEQDWRISHSKR